MKSYIEQASLDKAIENGASEEHSYEGEIEDALAVAGVNVAFFHARNFPLAHNYPHAPVGMPQWSPWLEGMASTKIYRQLDIMYRRVSALQRGSRVLAAALAKRPNGLELHKKPLVEEALEVRRALKALQKQNDQIVAKKSKSMQFTPEGQRNQTRSRQGWPPVTPTRFSTRERPGNLGSRSNRSLP